MNQHAKFVVEIETLDHQRLRTTLDLPEQHVKHRNLGVDGCVGDALARHIYHEVRRQPGQRTINGGIPFTPKQIKDIHPAVTELSLFDGTH